MKRLALSVAVLAACPAIAGVAWAHELDHPAPSFAPSAPLSSVVNAGGPNAEWELVTSIPTGNPHSDLDFFTHQGDTYASVGTLAVGANGGGQSIVRLTNGGVVEPEYVAGHPSASCLETTSSVTGLQHDAEATPKTGQILNTPGAIAPGGDAQLIVDATDATGRCHDQGVLGAANAPQGGLEFVDVTDPANPKEIGLTVHVGQSHTVNVDPKRPHIAFSVTSDSTSINQQTGARSNEASGNSMDGFEVVDFSSCMNFPAGTTIQQKRDACRPQVFRYRWPDPNFGRSSRYPNQVGACHEVEIYPDDKLTCASLFATILFDMSGAFDDNGTPGDFTDDKPRGTPLPCRVRPTSTVVPAATTDAMVTDCQVGENAQSLTVSEWLKIGAPSLEGVQRIGTVHHMGFENQQQQSVNPPFDSTEDIFVSHEAELTGSRNFVLATDERGGGVLPGGATCSPGVDNRIGNGGIHAYPVGSFTTSYPADAAAAQQAYAKNSEGENAIYRAATRTQPQASVCTSHVFHQIPGQNRIFMAWYSQGTQVVDFVENPDGTIDFKETGWFIPENASTWTSAIFKGQENEDGSFTYWGATGDFFLGGAGRNTIDVYKVTLPAPAQSYGPTGFPRSSVRGVENTGTPPACASTAAFERVAARGRRRGIRYSFTSRGSDDVEVKLFRQRPGRKRKLIEDYGERDEAFLWRPDRRLKRGYYYAQFKTTAANGRADRRRVALRRKRRRFRQLRPFERKAPCGLVNSLRLTKPVFGGRRNAPLKIRFQLAETSDVEVEIARRGRVVRRFRERSYAGGRVHRLRARLRRRARQGEYEVRLAATHPGRASQVHVTGRRLRATR